MKGLLIYWLIGCVMTGYAVAAHENRCPHDEPETMVELASATAVWPEVLVYLMLRSNHKTPACKVAP